MSSLARRLSGAKPGFSEGLDAAPMRVVCRQIARRYSSYRLI